MLVSVKYCKKRLLYRVWLEFTFVMAAAKQNTVEDEKQQFANAFENTVT